MSGSFARSIREVASWAIGLAEESRCTGHCCRDFSLPFSPGELRRRVIFEGLLDGEQIADMVIYLGWRACVFKKDGHRYTCRHLINGRDCGIYETRPVMCRDYPYGGRCKYEGCTRSLAIQSVEAKR